MSRYFCYFLSLQRKKSSVLPDFLSPLCFFFNSRVDRSLNTDAKVLCGLWWCICTQEAEGPQVENQFRLYVEILSVHKKKKKNLMKEYPFLGFCPLHFQIMFLSMVIADDYSQSVKITRR